MIGNQCRWDRVSKGQRRGLQDLQDTVDVVEQEATVSCLLHHDMEEGEQTQVSASSSAIDNSYQQHQH